MGKVELPLFPLGTVLFPGGPLSLRIFEPRYLDMISHCLKHGHGFGVVLINSGSEVGFAEFASVGTSAEVVDWYQRRDGLLGIEAEGRRRFRVLSSRREAGGLYVGEVEFLPPERDVTPPDDHADLRGLLEALLEDLGAQYARITKAYDDPVWLSYRLAELLPLPAATKQAMLELEDGSRRLELLRPHLENLETRPG